MYLQNGRFAYLAVGSSYDGGYAAIKCVKCNGVDSNVGGW